MKKILIGILVAVGIFSAGFYFLNDKINMDIKNQEEQLKTLALTAESMKGYWHGDESPEVEFEKVEIGQGEALVEFYYPTEGVAAKITFEKSGDNWQISDEKIVER